ncbi:hypothetical protein ACEUDP_18285 [Aeromonas caviae]|uniref:hypothetical protein n=1 Tax=Aeromonas caviae TaxID=648 RepID=UPI0038D0FEDE
MGTVRTDHTDYLVHWTRGDTDEAFDRLTSIAIDECIYGGNFGVRAGCNCVCFTEAPINHFHEREGFFQPFGIMVSKKWLFGLGGRPVIYQPEDDFILLPKRLQWKHVDYDITGYKKRDYSWQREWRIQTDKLNLPVSEVTLIVPDEDYYDELRERFSNENISRGLASCDSYGYGMGMPIWPTAAEDYRVEVIDW